MAIAFVSATKKSISVAATTSAVLTMNATSTVAGNTYIVVVSAAAAGTTITSVVDSVGNTYALQKLATGAPILAIYSTPVSGTISIPGTTGTITVTLATSSKATVTFLEFSGVVAIGTAATAAGTAANPSIALTTQDNNNFVVAGFAGVGVGAITAFTGGGTFDNAAVTSGGAASSNVSGAGNHNTAASPSSVTNQVTLVAETWNAVAFELRSVNPTVLSFVPFSDEGILFFGQTTSGTGVSCDTVDQMGGGSGAEVIPAVCLPDSLLWQEFAPIQGDQGFQRLTDTGDFVGDYSFPATWKEYFVGFQSLALTTNLSAVTAAFNGSLVKKTLKALSAIAAAFNGSLSTILSVTKALSATMAALNGALVKKTLKTLAAIAAAFNGSLAKKTFHNIAAVAHAFNGALNRLTLYLLNAASAAFSGSVLLKVTINTQINALMTALSATLTAAKTGGVLHLQSLVAAMSAFFGSVCKTFVAVAPQANPLASSVFGYYSANVAITGVDAIREIFRNPGNLDLIQIIDEGGKVVWYLNYLGVSSTNSDCGLFNPTLKGDGSPNALLGTRFCTDPLNPVATAFPDLKQDLLVIVRKGGAVVHRTDYRGYSFNL